MILAYSLKGHICVLPVDIFVLYENGQPVSAPMSFMIEEDKTNSQIGGWLPCMPGGCSKVRGQASITGGPNG